MDDNDKIPQPTIKRIPGYLRILYDFKKRDIEWISATDIANILGLKSIQVRKDMSFTNITGKPKKGYKVEQLIDAVRKLLGWDKVNNAYLVGSGALGAALLGYKGFKNYGLNISRAFDTSIQKIGTEIHGRTVQDIHQLKEFAIKEEIKVGVLTVPEASAQEAVDLMVDAGIKAIWNFSPITLKVPEDVIVQGEDLSAGLAVLCVNLQQSQIKQ
ncbi:MAG: redox-sensing transcriptional repressor Rex [Spirochaetales bacterium]|nr:redox-sensing transcriptional repressor Rex [Spirochaetales bacterium]